MSQHKRKGRILTTAAEMKRAELAAREREKTATKIRKVKYEPERDALVVDLSTAVTLIVPRALIPGFAKATPASVSDVAIDPGAESLWSDTVDDGVLLEQLVQIAAGDELLQVLGGRIAGRRRSPAKASAARTNGAKGGRPPLGMTTFLNHLDRRLHELAPDAPAMELSEDCGARGQARAHWQDEAGVVLELRPRDRNEVEVVRAAWTVKRSDLRRIRASAERLARDLARCLATRKRREAAVRAVEQTALSHHARSRNHGSAGRRRTTARRG
jgi:hypothetical protein